MDNPRSKLSSPTQSFHYPTIMVSRMCLNPLNPAPVLQPRPGTYRLGWDLCWSGSSSLDITDEFSSWFRFLRVSGVWEDAREDEDDLQGYAVLV